MLKHALSVLAFVVVSFAVQAMSHFVIFTDHFNAVGFARADPVIALGILVMVIQGLIMSSALAAWRGEGSSVRDGFAVAASFGAFLVAYIALVEPSKYAVPSIPAWFAIEAGVGVVQFALFGLALGWVHQRLGRG